MSDFLNFNVQDEILNGDPEFDIVQKANGKYEIDLATEVIQEGTDLNKLTFDKLKKINCIMGYNEVDSVIEGTTLKFNLEETHFPYIKNQLLNIKTKTIPSIYDFSSIKNSIDRQNNFKYNNNSSYGGSATLPNGNFVFFNYQYSSSSNKSMFIYMVNKKGETIKSVDITADNNICYSIKYYNGLIYFFGGSKAYVYDEELNLKNTIDLSSQMGSNINNVEALIDDNTIYLFYATSSYFYLSIYDINFNLLKNRTQIGSNSHVPEVIDLYKKGNYIYATTSEGGEYRRYNIYKYDVINNTKTSISSSTTKNVNNVIHADNILYFIGGDADYNIIYKYNIDDETFSTLYSGSGYTFYKQGILIDDNIYIVYSNSSSPGYYTFYVRKININTLEVNDVNILSLCGLSGTASGDTKQIFKIGDYILITFYYNSISRAVILNKNLEYIDKIVLTDEVIDGQNRFSLYKENFIIQTNYKTSNSNSRIHNIEFNVLVDNIKIDNVNCDTLLKENTFYKLIFNEVGNKFIANEENI